MHHDASTTRHKMYTQNIVFTVVFLPNVISFLLAFLEPWSEDRRNRKDYRILYLDVYASHLDADVRDLCWSRGYVLLFHYGHTTGVAQINDTDLHAALSKLYQDYEMLSMLEQQKICKSDISRSHQQVVGSTHACTYVRTYVRTRCRHIFRKCASIVIRMCITCGHVWR